MVHGDTIITETSVMLNMIIAIAGLLLLAAFLVFAFRQGEKVKPSDRRSDASDAISLIRDSDRSL
jgi:hypothetical protein